MFQHDGHRVLRGETGLARDESVEGSPKAVDIRRRGHLAARALFGAHVVRSPHHGPDGRDVAGRGVVFRLGQAEIGDLDDTVIRGQQVARLDVAVKDADLLRVREPGGGLHDVVQCHLRVQPVGLLRRFLQALPVYKFHDEEVEALAFTEVIDVGDILVAESGDRMRLSPETLDEVLSAAQLSRQDLECDRPLQGDLMGPVDVAHCSLSDQLKNFAAAHVTADHLFDLWWVRVVHHWMFKQSLK